MSNIELRPAYWANVSGGKDSLYMLYLILKHPELYPLDGVVHFELEIDYPFIKDVTAEMERACQAAGVKFVRIKPRKTWMELYEKYGFPVRTARWCNSVYKMDARKQLDDWMKSLGKYVVAYIGYCADEVKRYEKRGEKYDERYPLVELGIQEDDILKWAKTQPIFHSYYLTNRRCGCMFCPMASRRELAYMLKYYPDKYEFMIEAMRGKEKMLEAKKGRPIAIMSGNPKYNADYIDKNVREKWLPKLEEAEKGGRDEQL